MAAAEASCRAGPAGEEGARGGYAGPGSEKAWRAGQAPPGRLCGARACFPGEGGGTGVISGGPPPASPGELRRPRLGSPPLRPGLQGPLWALCTQTPAAPRPHLSGDCLFSPASGRD